MKKKLADLSPSLWPDKEFDEMFLDESKSENAPSVRRGKEYNEIFIDEASAEDEQERQAEEQFIAEEQKDLGYDPQ